MELREQIQAEDERFRAELRKYAEFETLDDPTLKRLQEEHKERCREITQHYLSEYYAH